MLLLLYCGHPSESFDGLMKLKVVCLGLSFLSAMLYIYLLCFPLAGFSSTVHHSSLQLWCWVEKIWIGICPYQLSDRRTYKLGTHMVASREDNLQFIRDSTYMYIYVHVYIHLLAYTCIMYVCAIIVQHGLILRPHSWPWPPSSALVCATCFCKGALFWNLNETMASTYR